MFIEIHFSVTAAWQMLLSLSLKNGWLWGCAIGAGTQTSEERSQLVGTDDSDDVLEKLQNKFNCFYQTFATTLKKLFW